MHQEHDEHRQKALRLKGERRIFIVTPALNEEEAIPQVLAELPAELVDLHVICDNGSTDATAIRAREGGAQVVAESRRGYGRACQTALEAIREGRFADPPRPHDLIAFLDADHSDYPEDLSALCLPILEDRAEFVVGSRVRGGATMDALLPQAWFGNRLACFLMRVCFGARWTDLGPFRVLRFDALEHLDMRDEDFGWTVEMQLKAAVCDLRSLEVPVRYRARIGTSKITGTISGTLRAGFKILGWILGWRAKLFFTRQRIPKFRGSERSAPQ
ncbi:MAG: glycosyltransferase family 2 protein [Planctomycetota bacterium]